MKNNIGMTLVLALILCGCDDGGGDTSPPPTAPARPPDKMIGYFLNIKGVRYKSTCGGDEGVTGDRGVFHWTQSYGRGDVCVVTFSIGSKMQLGYSALLRGEPTRNQVDALALTPYDLVKYDYYARLGDDHTPDPTHEVARNNIVTILESLNARPNSRGVIEISTETDQFAEAAGWSIPFAVPDFRERATALLGPANKKLIETTQAVNAYAPTVNCRNTGYYIGSGSGGSGPTQYDYKGNATGSESIDVRMNGLATPDGNMWLYLMDRQSSSKVVDYDVWSGSVAPGRFGLGFDAVGSVSSGSVYFEDGFHIQSDNVARTPAVKDWTTGRLGATQDERTGWFMDRLGGSAKTPHYYDLPELKFAGRTDTYLLSLEVYADNTVRAIVNDAKSDTYVGNGDAALLSGSVTGDSVTAEGSSVSTEDERSFKLMGKFDRLNMTVTVTVTVTTPTQPDPQLYMSVTAPGCEVSPKLDAI